MKWFYDRRWWELVGVALIITLITSGGTYYLRTHAASAGGQYQTPEEASNIYVRFTMEGFDSIQKNYWNKLSDADLANWFKLSLEKAANIPDAGLSTTTRAATATMLAAAFANATSTDAEKQLALTTLTVALYNLQPAGRDNLLSAAQTTQLRQEVANVNPSSDLYGVLGLPKGASVEEVEQAYQQKAAALRAATSSEAQEELKNLVYADTVLTNANTKTQYDQTQVEPTGFARLIGHTLYFDMSKISPTTLQEFAMAVDAASTTPGLDSMILDVRSNVGGAFDFAAGFLGLFLGPNQYAFDLYHHGEFEAQRTTTPRFGQLDRYTNIAILTDGMTQSTAEVLAAALKRFHIARVVGTTTRGWGTVENTYPLETQLDPNETYSLLLVNNITLDEHNIPIEGQGIKPDLDSTTPGWKPKLRTYFNSASIIEALMTEAAQKPQRR